MQLLMYNAILYIDRLAKVGDIGGDQEAQKVYLLGQYSNQSSYFKSFWYTNSKAPLPGDIMLCIRIPSNRHIIINLY